MTRDELIKAGIDTLQYHINNPTTTAQAPAYEFLGLMQEEFTNNFPLCNVWYKGSECPGCPFFVNGEQRCFGVHAAAMRTDNIEFRTDILTKYLELVKQCL